MMIELGLEKRLSADYADSRRFENKNLGVLIYGNLRNLRIDKMIELGFEK